MHNNQTLIVMDSQIRHIDSIAEYNKYLGVETLHPLVSVIDLSKANKLKHARQTFGFYCVFLKSPLAAYE